VRRKLPPTVKADGSIAVVVMARIEVNIAALTA
jgi:hypothetical protein